MLHNYYLYENDGLLSILPWDYNLAFGSFSQGGKSGDNDATTLINTGIDTPLSGTTESDRTLWNWITSDETYLEKYHSIYENVIAEYFESGEFDSEIDRVYEMIRSYVENDNSAFYSVEEFDEGYSTLREFCN